MLSGLAVCAALTALVAGITGAWSPCGFSMVETIGSALGDVRRAVTIAASATFALGTLLGGAITFGGLAALGSLAGHGFTGLREGLGAALALAAAIADWRGVKIAPQIRRQVPERWRWRLPLPLACALYGVLLGLGFTTFVLAFAVWALAGISFASGDVLLGVLVGVVFGAGRALPVLWMAPGLRRGKGAVRLEEIAAEPRLWLGLRRLDALGLGLCALALGGASASAATIAGASDPSTAGGALVWQAPGGGGLLSFGGAPARALPGTHPALGGSTIAWVGPATVTVADARSLQPRLTLAASGVDALAVSDGWLVYRDTDAAGTEQLIAVSLTAPASKRYLAGSRLAGQIGRPSLDGANAVFTVDTPRRSAIELIDLTSGKRRTLRAARPGTAYFYPSLLGGSLLYEQVTRCEQQLWIGTSAARRGGAHAARADADVAVRGRRSRRERVLLSLPSAVSRDPGYQRGYTHAYNSASGCANRRTGRGASTELGSTALGPSRAYVTLTGSRAGARIVSVAR
ncbi:MAG TPA: hypothetical protein VG188_07245 [Solirubrobacteraceae bacterium]|nr:hypothetical protein [Solirubrobacteraceae bacterium]